jgi:hypothetical protein
MILPTTGVEPVASSLLEGILVRRSTAEPSGRIFDWAMLYRVGKVERYFILCLRNKCNARLPVWRVGSSLARQLREKKAQVRWIEGLARHSAMHPYSTEFYLPDGGKSSCGGPFSSCVRKVEYQHRRNHSFIGPKV